VRPQAEVNAEIVPPHGANFRNGEGALVLISAMTELCDAGKQGSGRNRGVYPDT